MKTLAAVAVLLLAGCSAAEPVEPVTETLTETTTATETEAGPTATETVTETATHTAAAETGGDPTEEFLAEYGRERWADKVVEVQREGDSIHVRTTIVDPRDGTTGSPEAGEALDICRAAVEMFDPRSVRVMESNDSTFAHAGIDGPQCVEY